MTRRVLVTGAREWTAVGPVWDALEEQYQIAQDAGENLVVVHGNARGADRMARIWVQTKQRWGHTDVDEDSNSADWNRYGKAAGPIRNTEMVDKGADICLAFPLPGSIGTIDCMEKAKRADIPVKDLGDKGDSTDAGREGQGSPG